MRDMKPGDRVSGTVRIGSRGRAGRTRFYLGLSRLVETAGPAGGRLSSRLQLWVERVSPRHRPTTVYAAPLRRMPLLKLGVFRPREMRTYRFTVDLPEGGAAVDDLLQQAGTSLQFTWYARRAR